MCVHIWHLFHIRDRKYRIEINYLLIADLHIFVYGRSELSSISLECTKVKLLILNDFYNNECVMWAGPSSGVQLLE